MFVNLPNKHNEVKNDTTEVKKKHEGKRKTMGVMKLSVPCCPPVWKRKTNRGGEREKEFGIIDSDKNDPRIS